MSDGEPGSTLSLAYSLVLGSGTVLCLLLAGMASAFTTLMRMQKGGLVSSEAEPMPGSSLLARPRQLLLTLSIAYLAGACVAAAALPTVARPWAEGTGPLGWGIVVAGFLLLLLLGSVFTKALALSRPVGFARTTLWLAWLMFIVLMPLTRPLLLLMDRLAPSLGSLDILPPFSGGEIREILADEEAAGLMEEDERSLVRGIFDLRDTEIKEIMVPRIDMRGLDVETSFEEAEAFAIEQPFTRLPVWQENQDNIVGILHSKDLLKSRAASELPTVRQLLRQVHFLPESKTVDEALSEFRENRVHLAVVVDEYGGTAGIVTMEDILEEIVGEIRDEFDQEGEKIRVMDDRHVVIDPRIDLDDLNEALGTDLPTEDSDTLGGFLYAELGRVPSRGDTVEHEGLRFTIDRVERQRMLQVTLVSDEPLELAADHKETPAHEGTG